MNVRNLQALLLAGLTLSVTARPAAAAPAPQACRRATFEGELHAGQSFAMPIGNGLQVFFQPIASGWILRVFPTAGPSPAHDYAELATPPYQSVTPLSISTDFAFRAQDAVGWNPRRFRFATSADAFQKLQAAFLKLGPAGSQPSGAVQAELATQISHAAEGTLTILDARLTPGTADQWQAAAAVAAHFLTTAHTLVPPEDGAGTPLGRLLWLRFRVELDLPPGFSAARGLHQVPQTCGTP